MKVIVTGSLGNISQPLTEALIQKGQEVVVISSKQNKQKDIEALGAQAAIGSVDDVDFLTATFTGADVVYCMVPPDYFKEDQVEYYSKVGHNYVKAIQQSGVKRVLYLSSYGAHLEKDTGFILGAHHVEQLMNKLDGITVTFLRPGYFYYNLLNFAGMINAAGMIAANYGGEDKLAMVSPKDISSAVADEIITPSGNKIIYIISDDSTCNEVASVLGKAIGKPDLQWQIISSEQMQKGMESNGVPSHIAHNLTELGAAIHSGVLRGDLDKQQPVMGKVKIEDYAQEFAAAFQKH